MAGTTELRQLTARELREVYDRLYREAFPPLELRPFSSILELTAAGEYRTLGLFEYGDGLAYASIWDAGRGYALLDYLVVPPEKRGGGAGSAMLAALRSRMPAGGVLMIESEAPTGDPKADELILRRLDFYRRCGAAPAGFDAAVFGVRYRLLSLSNGMPDEAEFLRRYRALYHSRITGALWDRAFRIPVEDGEDVPMFGKWIENTDGYRTENGADKKAGMDEQYRAAEGGADQ